MKTLVERLEALTEQNTDKCVEITRTFADELSSEEQMRKEFEEWCNTNGLSAKSITGNGYNSKRTQWCWRAYKGCIAKLRQRIVGAE